MRDAWVYYATREDAERIAQAMRRAVRRYLATHPRELLTEMHDGLLRHRRVG